MKLTSLGQFDSLITGISVAPGDPDNLYVTLQKGIAYKYNPKTKNIETFLDLSHNISALYLMKPKKSKFADERGLLTLVFHPQYNTPGNPFQNVFIVMSSELANKNMYDSVSHSQVSDPDNMTCISMFKLGRTFAETMNSREFILCVPEPEFNHNGGGLCFGPDGFLWIGYGDGGGAGDQHGPLINPNDPNSYFGFAQNPMSYHGKILRIDVNPPGSNPKYNIPSDNPFLNDSNWRPEIVALGLRNPWRMKFDHEGKLFIGEVGQDRIESVKVLDQLGQNFGWRAMEGNEVFNQTVLQYLIKLGETITPPIISYGRDLGFAITGVIPYDERNIVICDYGGNILQGYKENNGWKVKLVMNSNYMNTSLDRGHNNRAYLSSYDKDTKKGHLFELTSNPHGSLFGIVSESEHGPEPEPELDFNSNNNPNNGIILTEGDIRTIVNQAIEAAGRTTSALRRDGLNVTKCKMHIAIIRRGEPAATVYYSSPDAWQGSIDIAKGKAYTAMAFSSDENALSTRGIGELSQPGKPLWGIGHSNLEGAIITFPGGLPLYLGDQLVGGIGVSGDSVENDEIVAHAAAKGFDASIYIRSDQVAGIPY